MLFRSMLSLLGALSTPAWAQETPVAAGDPVSEVLTPCAATGAADVTSQDEKQCLPDPGAVRRGDENVISQANDAFGYSSGKESIGVYSMSNIRGFSPISAGNVRIDGLYFDQVFGLTNRVRESTSIRVGLSAQGLPFPAPTGIVDYQLYKPGPEGAVSALVSIDSWGTVTGETDFVFPLGPDGLSIGGGLYAAAQNSYDGTSSFRDIQGLSLRWSASARSDVIVFWTRSSVSDDERAPRYVPAGAFLPPRVTPREFTGPSWADYNSVGQTYGATAAHQIGSSWQFKAGLFRSQQVNTTDFVQLYQGIDPRGNGRRVIIADPPTRSASTSGELRLSRSIIEGPRHHLVSFSLWARSRDQGYGGGEAIDFGPIAIGQPIPIAKPRFAFSDHPADAIRQWTGGIAYRGVWTGRGELNLGIARTHYNKSVHLPGNPVRTSEASPLIHYGSLSLRPTAALTVYASMTRGLEESGVAPESAVNRNEPLPAILTSQREFGFSYAIAPSLTILADVFELTKPYYNLNQQGRYALLGDIRNRGLEFSVAGVLSENVNLIAGAVLLDPLVSGEAVQLGRVGRRPVGLARETFTLNLDWKPVKALPLSLDVSSAHQGDVVATRDNLVSIPARLLLDVGARYRFNLMGTNSTLRVRVTNVTGEEGFQLRGAGAYDIIPGRVLTAYLASNF
jgi:iron complex outermembrane receptor protein